MYTESQTSLYKQNSIFIHAQVKVMVLYSLPEGDMGEYTKWMIRLINYLDRIAYIPTLLPPPPPPQKKCYDHVATLLKMWENFTPTGTWDTYSWRQQYLLYSSMYLCHWQKEIMTWRVNNSNFKICNKSWRMRLYTEIKLTSHDHRCLNETHSILVT